MIEYTIDGPIYFGLTYNQIIALKEFKDKGGSFVDLAVEAKLECYRLEKENYQLKCKLEVANRTIERLRGE